VLLSSRCYEAGEGVCGRGKEGTGTMRESVGWLNEVFEAPLSCDKLVLRLSSEMGEGKEEREMKRRGNATTALGRC
jgi:hypothetical protein